ncbi:hypothetical protein [Paenibacillus sp. Soil787]|uniref:hypothetical protein n=1 Tax=Paenibacillus sp. Soil787 TaxID=1736411 RepID=UPI0006F5846A|nr:hypothetical protein [Paenibacillus sp. Soil787]KRF35887.1 hypothetical protein ASG93_25735 [Paenibacillus sp. Soil787]
MHKLIIQIAEHQLEINVASAFLKDWLVAKFHATEIMDCSQLGSSDLTILIEDGYGTPFESFDVNISTTPELITYLRNDYRIQVFRDFTHAYISAYDDFALNHALLLLYSGFIAHHGWGLMTHSSCIMSEGHAYLFAGQSGAGKSTAALLSSPRMVLSDEAALVKVTDNSVRIYNSPFRSDSFWEREQMNESYELKGYHILRQSQQIKRHPVQKAEAMIFLMNTIFYWAFLPEETAKVVAMCRKLVNNVTFYELYFQKNNLFWEVIHEHTHEQYV